jgi:hypothetical protein
VALTLPDDPGASSRLTGGSASAEKGYLSLTRKIRIKGRRLHFYLVPGEEPYYISDEISANQWKRVMAAEPPDRERGLAVGMSRQERLRFAETCSRLADKPLAVASIAEVDSAIAKGAIDPPKPPKRKKSVRSTQRSRRVRSKLSPWTELVGVRLSPPDDPVLLDFKGDYNEKLPLRLVLKLH